MNTQHTPGPWASTKLTITGADGLKVATLHGIRTMALDTLHANVCVVAAAPDMLAALHAVGRFLAAQGVDPRTPAFAAVNAAIAKASGA